MAVLNSLEAFLVMALWQASSSGSVIGAAGDPYAVSLHSSLFSLVRQIRQSVSCVKLAIVGTSSSQGAGQSSKRMSTGAPEVHLAATPLSNLVAPVAAFCFAASATPRSLQL